MEDTLRFAFLSHAMDVRIYGPLLVLVTLSTLPKLPTVCAIVLARLDDILSWVLNVKHDPLLRLVMPVQLS